MKPLDTAIQELQRQADAHESSMRNWLHGAVEELADLDVDRVEGHVKQALQELHEFRGCMNAIMVLEEQVQEARDKKKKAR